MQTKESDVQNARRPKPAVLAALGLVLAWAAWYCRPMTLWDLVPPLEPDGIVVLVSRADVAWNLMHESYTLDADEGREILEGLEAVRLHRSLLNPIRSFWDRLYHVTVYRQEEQSNSYHWDVSVLGADGVWVTLQYFAGKWEYNTPSQPQYLPCFVPDGKNTGERLGKLLWEYRAPSRS